MKLLLTTLLLSVSLGYATPSESDSPYNNGEKKEKKKKGEEESSRNKNAHSVKKWKVIVEYINGNVISKTIVVAKDSELSALETAFAEADKYLKNKKYIKEYSVSPIAGNPYVLLAGE